MIDLLPTRETYVCRFSRCLSVFKRTKGSTPTHTLYKASTHHTNMVLLQNIYFAENPTEAERLLYGTHARFQNM